MRTAVSSDVAANAMTSTAMAGVAEGEPIVSPVLPAALSEFATIGKRAFEAGCAECHGEHAADGARQREQEAARVVGREVEVVDQDDAPITTGWVTASGTSPSNRTAAISSNKKALASE